MGVETDVPVINDKTFELNFSNEGGVDGKFCLQRNITGLWILEQFKQSEKELAHYDYERLIGKAQRAPGFISAIDPCDPIFLNPSNMGDAIATYLTSRNQKVPNAVSHMVRLILESLAFKYRQTLDQLKQISTTPINKIHIIGGGARNYLLNQFTANATGLPVIAGPYEGTAIGNIIVQAISDKSDNRITDIHQGRQVIKNSVKLKMFEPENCDQWESVYLKYLEIINF
jgi:rhamnulokinase